MRSEYRNDAIVTPTRRRRDGRSGTLPPSMRLSDEEMALLDAACANPDNIHGQNLLNVFGAERAIEIVERMPTIPIGIVVDVVSHLWMALSFEAKRLGIPDFALVEPQQIAGSD